MWALLSHAFLFCVCQVKEEENSENARNSHFTFLLAYFKVPEWETGTLTCLLFITLWHTSLWFWYLEKEHPPPGYFGLLLLYLPMFVKLHLLLCLLVVLFQHTLSWPMLQRTVKHCRHAWGKKLIFLSTWSAALKLTGVAEGAVDVLWVVLNWSGESWERHEVWNKKLYAVMGWIS